MKKYVFAFTLVVAALASTALLADPFTTGRSSGVTADMMTAFGSPFMQQIVGMQRHFHEVITDQIETLKDGQSFAALWELLLISLGYGVFHVLAPGHGKVIVGSYFLGNNANWRDGVWAGLLMAVGHTITAVGLVIVLYLVMGLGQFKTLDDARYIELLGYALIAVIGCWLLWRAIKNKPQCTSCGHEHHGHEHHHHDHDHNHTPHHQETSVLKNRQATGLFAVASLVPCTGSMIILLFTLANGVLWAGILSVIAIALGMWVTVTAIGLISILLRRSVVGSEAKHQSGFRRGFSQGLRVFAALIVIATGGLLFSGTLYSLLG